MGTLGVLFIAVAPPFAAKGAAKPFAKIESREVFMRAIELYANRDQTQQRVLCVHADDLQIIQEKYAAHLGFQGVSVTAGGPDWFGVVARGLEKLKPEVDTVIVHDASCPSVPYTLLDNLEAAVEKTGAAAPVVATGAHLAKVAGNTLDASVDSATLHEIQSPQIFQRQVLVDAYAKRSTVGGGGTKVLDDASLVRLAGGTVMTIAGSRYNLRVDSDESLRLAGDFLKHLPKQRKSATLNPFGEAEW